MLSQQPTNMRWPEEETTSSSEQTSPSASSWRGRDLWFRLLGVGIAFVAGFALMFLPTPGEVAWNLFLLSVVLTGVVSAGFLRSWWSLLIVPVAFDLGHAFGESFQFGFDKFVPSLVLGVVVLLIVLVEIGVFIGTPIGNAIERRLRH